MSTKRLSVIIPGYNNPEKWWQRCIDSVLRNISAADEIICVDDASSSRPIILEEYSRKDNRINVIFRECNGGLSVARNCAMEVAHGKYLTFVDSDDEVLPGTYERALSAIEAHEASVVIYGVNSIWVAERLIERKCPDDANIGKLTPSCLKELYDESLFNYAWNKIYRTQFLNEHKLRFDPTGMPCEDIIFNLHCVMAGATWATIAHVGINYYKTHNSLLSKYKPSYVRGMKAASDIWIKYKEFDYTARKVLGDVGEVSDPALVRGEWDNIWRKGSPYTLAARWKFLSEHSDVLVGNQCICFLKKMIYTILRKLFYTSQVKRWHIRRVYKDAKPL